MRATRSPPPRPIPCSEVPRVRAGTEGKTAWDSTRLGNLPRLSALATHLLQPGRAGPGLQISFFPALQSATASGGCGVGALLGGSQECHMTRALLQGASKIRLSNWSLTRSSKRLELPRGPPPPLWPGLGRVGAGGAQPVNC